MPGAFIPMQWRKRHWGGKGSVWSSGSRRRFSAPRRPKVKGRPTARAAPGSGIG
jgi:hypothetical protein